MNFQNKNITIKTKKLFDILDITDKVLDFVKNSKITNGLINIQTMHTTAMLILNENEPLLLEDIKKNLERLAPKKDVYTHDNFEIRTVNMCDDECANGHSHCKAIFLSPNIVLNLIENKIQLGKWQRILYVELDRAKERTIQLAILGG
jgi:secondary thiamine-phosphate synthase enzyme